MSTTEMFITYYPNGNKCEEYSIINGVIEGSYVHYYLNGQVYISCNYLNNKKHGIYEKYNEKGNLIKQYHY